MDLSVLVYSLFMAKNITDDGFNEDLTETMIDKLKTHKRLNINYSYNKSIDNLPEGIEYIVFNCKFIDYYNGGSSFDEEKSAFNQTINRLPSTLLELNMGDCENFDKEIVDFPPLLVKLILPRYSYNLDNVSQCLTHLIINGPYTGSLDNLPNTLEHLEISGLSLNNNTCSLDCLPQNLLTLKLYCEYDGIIDNLPPRLETLHLSYLTQFNKLDKLPQTLINLTVRGNIDPNNLPNNVKDLKLDSWSPEIKFTKLPNNIKSLQIARNCRPSNFPETLKKITLIRTKDEDKWPFLEYILEIHNIKLDYNKLRIRKNFNYTRDISKIIHERLGILIR